MDMTKLKTGQAAMKSAKRGGFFNNIYWKEDKEVRFLAFLTPFEEVPGLPIHMYETANGWRTFVCRKAAIFEDESQGRCDICSLMVKGKERDPAKPNFKQIALAVELEPVYERVEGREKLVGFEVKMDEYEKDGETKTAPAIGMVSQAPSNFWVPMASTVDRKGDITEYVLEVERKGKGKNAKVSYTFFDHPGRELVDLQLEEYVPEEGWLKRLHNWIEEHGDQTRYEEELSGVSSSRDDDGDGDEREEATPESTEATKSRFDELRAKLEAKETGESDSSTSA